jgi:hypothetical protein
MMLVEMRKKAAALGVSCARSCTGDMDVACDAQEGAQAELLIC